MKKLIALLLAGVMCAGLLVGCGGDNKPAETQPAESASLLKPRPPAFLRALAPLTPVNGWGAYDDLITEIKTTTDFGQARGADA